MNNFQVCTKNVCYSIISMVTTLFLLENCNVSNIKSTSFWEARKSKFKHKDLKEFMSDSALHAEIGSLQSTWDKSIDTISSKENVYLYSWQNSDSPRNEFTVVREWGELNWKIYYVIMDKNDKLISTIGLASMGKEADLTFEIRSRFVSRDSIYQTRAVTKTYDLENRKKMDKPVGDTTFSYFVINKDGTITERVIREVKALNHSAE